MSQENNSLVQSYYQKAMSDLSGIEDIVAASFVDHHFPPEMPAGPDGVKKFFTEFMSSIFSEPKIEIDFLLAEGNKVDCHFVFHGKHTGDGAGIPPKGNTISLSAISTFRIEYGKLAEALEIYDSGSMVQQMQE